VSRRSSGDSASPIRIIAVSRHARTAPRRKAIDAGTVPKVVLPRRTRSLALVIGTSLVWAGEIQTPVRVTDDVVRPVEAPTFVVVDKRIELAVRAHARQDRSSLSQTIRRPCRSKVVPLPPIVVLTRSGSLPGVRRYSLSRRRSTKYQYPSGCHSGPLGKNEAGGEALGFSGLCWWTMTSLRLPLQ
jgi:hypothetical protein